MDSLEIEKIRKNCPYIKTIGAEASKDTYETLRVKKPPPKRIEIRKYGKQTIWICSEKNGGFKAYKVNSRGTIREMKIYLPPEF